ncbi:MAG TPA: hypothetical protein V6C81_20980 [Planktothrix sp.]|jgi:UDP-N-acetylmuramoyl-tripeptide--D-alanyl-D-alanine ligase
MAAQFTGEEIIELTKGRLAQGMMPDEAAELCSDTRRLAEGWWFVALPGKHFDGHDFLGDAFSAGALGCIVEERGSYPIASTSFPLIAVDNTYDAFQQLARNWRKRLNPRVIAVTACPSEPSAVVELCAKILAPEFSLLTHEDGDVESLFNAEAALDETTRILIAKVAPGELTQAELVGRALAPTIVVLTEDGFSHLRAANEDVIARAECDLLAHMDKNRGSGIVSKRSRDLLRRLKYHFGERTKLFDDDEIKIETAEDGRSIMHIVGSSVGFPLGAEIKPADLWCAVQACKQIGLPDDRIASRLS